MRRTDCALRKRGQFGPYVPRPVARERASARSRELWAERPGSGPGQAALELWHRDPSGDKDSARSAGAEPNVFQTRATRRAPRLARSAAWPPAPCAPRVGWCPLADGALWRSSATEMTQRRGGVRTDPHLCSCHRWEADQEARGENMRTVRHARARCTPQLRYAQTAQEGEGHGHRTGRGHRSDTLFCELRRLGTHLQSQARRQSQSETAGGS